MSHETENTYFQKAINKKKIAVWANGVETINFQVVPGRETSCEVAFGNGEDGARGQEVQPSWELDGIRSLDM